MKLHHFALRDSSAGCAEFCMHGCVSGYSAGVTEPVACACCRVEPSVDVCSWWRPEAEEYVAYGLCRTCRAEWPGEKVTKLVELAITTGRLEVFATDDEVSP